MLRGYPVLFLSSRNHLYSVTHRADPFGPVTGTQSPVLTSRTTGAGLLSQHYPRTGRMEQEFGQGSRIQVGGTNTVIGSSQAGILGFSTESEARTPDPSDKFGWNKPLNRSSDTKQGRDPSSKRRHISFAKVLFGILHHYTDEGSFVSLRTGPFSVDSRIRFFTSLCPSRIPLVELITRIPSNSGIVGIMR